MRRKSLIVLALCGFIAVVAQAAPAGLAAQPASTVGDFAVKVAIAMGYEAPSATDAAATLRSRGVDLNADLGARLTEGDAAAVLERLGVPVVSPGDPGRLVSASKATALAGFASAAVNHSGGNGTDDLDLGPFLACLHSDNYAACVNCCQGIIPDGPGRLICPLVCKLNKPPNPSASVPAS